MGKGDLMVESVKFYEEIQKASIYKRIKFLFKDFSIYGVSLLISNILLLITIPILTRIFSKSEFGVIDGITVLKNFIFLFIIMGQDSAIPRFFYETDNENERRQIVSQSLFFVIGLSLFISFFLYINAESIVYWFLKAPEYEKAFKIIVCAMPCIILVRFCQNLLKWTFSRQKYIILSVGSTFLVVSLTFFLVVLIKKDVILVFYAELIGMLLFSIIGFYFCKPFLERPKNIRYLFPLLKFGLPYMCVYMISAIMLSVDRYFISNLITLEALAIYAVGYKIATFLNPPISSFQTAWGPFSYSIYKEDNSSETYNKVFTYYTIFLIFLVLLIIFLGRPLIILFASEKYIDSIIVIVPLVFAVAIESISYFTGLGISLSKKTHYSAIAYMISLITSIAAIKLMIVPFGIIGVAYSILLGKIALTISVTIFAQKNYHLRFDIFKPCCYIALGFFMAIMFQSIMFLTWYYEIGLFFSFMIILIVIVWNKMIPLEDKKLLNKLIPLPKILLKNHL